jgi:hypothetical protein
MFVPKETMSAAASSHPRCDIFSLGTKARGTKWGNTNGKRQQLQTNKTSKQQSRASVSSKIV